MAETTAISWTATVLPDGTSIPGATFNPWTGCFKISDGCKFCYASDQRKRYGHTNEWGPVATSLRTVTSDAYWKQPLRWDRQAKESGIRRKVFCASLADVFEDVGEHHPQVTEARQRLWWLIQQTPYLDWLLLTKRPENVLDMVPSKWLMRGFPSHVWIGTSVEHQAAAEERIPELLKIPARIRWLSCEPLLSQIDLTPYLAGGLQNDDRRNGDPSVDSTWCAICRQRRPRMATQRNIEGISDSRAGGSMQTTPSRYGTLSQGWLSPYSSDNWKDTVRLTGTQNSVDGQQSEDDSQWLRDQPQGWDQGQQPPGQPRTGDTLRERDPLASYIGQLPDSQYPRSEVVTRTSCGDSSSLRSEGDATCPNCGNVWYHPKGRSEYREPQRVGMDSRGISWCVVGGESGPHHRPMDLSWALSLRDQCRVAHIPFFYKQTGGRTSGAGGHLLDGQEYHEWPEGVSYASAK